MIRISEIEPLQTFSTSHGFVRIVVFLLRSERKKAISEPIQCDMMNQKKQALDIAFELKYRHHIKGDPADVLQISLQKRRKTSRSMKTFATVQITLQDVLQQPLDNAVVEMLDAKTDKKDKDKRNDPNAWARLRTSIVSIPDWDPYAIGPLPPPKTDVSGSDSSPPASPPIRKP